MAQDHNGLGPLLFQGGTVPKPHPDAAELKERVRVAKSQGLQCDVTIAGADPVNLIGILIPGERVPAIPGRTCTITSGMLELSGPSRAQRRYSQRRVPSRQGDPTSARIEPRQAELI
jgi:hypothetical protein